MRLVDVREGEEKEVLGKVGANGTSLSPLRFDQVSDCFADKASGALFVTDGDGGENNRVLKIRDAPGYELLAHAGVVRERRDHAARWSRRRDRHAYRERAESVRCDAERR